MEDASVETNAEHVAPVWEPSETEKWGMNESLDNDGKQCVRSLQEAFQWMLHFERGVARTWGEEALRDLRIRLFRTLGSQSYATMFSGIDAPSTALETINKVVAGGLGLPPRKMQHVMAIEWDEECQKELLCHPCAPACMFGDISDSYLPCFKRVIDKAKKNGQSVHFDALLPIVMSGNALSSTMPCKIHGKHCRIPTFSHCFMGSPCTDWSVIGRGDGLNGDTMEHCMAMCAMLRMIQPSTFSHENVVGFDGDILQSTLGDLYQIIEVPSNSCDLGWPANRKRTIRVGIHKMKVARQIHEFSKIHDIMNRNCLISWQNFLFADPQSAVGREELEWARKRAGSENDIFSAGARILMDLHKDPYGGGGVGG